MSPEQITTYAAIVQAAAAVVSLIVAGVLAFVTHRYMKLTKGILDETAKARVAAERSASAAQESASATFQSLHLMRQQLEEQAGIGRLTVESTIDSAVAAIHHLKSQGLGQWAVVRALPSTANLFPQKANAASDHAARISTALAMKLSTAFDDLRLAFDQIERLRNLVSALGIDSGALSPTAVKADELLTRALTKFMEAKASFHPQLDVATEGMWAQSDSGAAYRQEKLNTAARKRSNRRSRRQRQAERIRTRGAIRAPESNWLQSDARIQARAKKINPTTNSSPQERPLI